MKAAEAAKLTAQRLAANTGDQPMIVSSFSPEILAEVMREGPSLQVAPAWPATLAFWARSRLATPPPLGGQHVALQASQSLQQVAGIRRVPIIRNLRVADRRLVKAAHRCDLAVHVWTLNERDEIERALADGVDGIMTDRPSELMRILDERGVGWSG